MQFKKNEDGTLSELPQKNVDFGGGLERIAAALNDDPDIFKIDIFSELIKKIEDETGKKYDTDQKQNRSFRIIADHLRASCNLLAEGVIPANKLHGYILRRLIRRMMFHFHLLGSGISGSSVSHVAESLQKEYPNVAKNWDFIEENLNTEATRFESALKRGLAKLTKTVSEGVKIDGRVAFDLYQNDGFPLELTMEILSQNGMTFSVEEKNKFESEFQKHKENSRSMSAGIFKGGLESKSDETITKLHTTTHLLHAALRQILGEHVSQKGSHITAERLRFDFSHPQKLTDVEVKQVEDLINQKIKEELPVSFETMTLPEAIKEGRLHFFGEKYGKEVKVYSIGSFSKEVCGGPHVGNTKEIGRVNINKTGENRIGNNPNLCCPRKMNLKDFLASRDKPPELFWSLVIEKGWVQAGIWYLGEGSAEVLNISPGAAWKTEDELVGACDAALSSSVAKLPENYAEPNKTVFGVSSSWVKGGEIGDEYLAKIKQVCTDLSLTPVGFVVLPEAIAHLYKSEEGAPLSAIIIGLGDESLEISVFQLGNLIGTTDVARSVSIIDDVTEGLSRFEGASPLPSRMIVFDGKGGELEEAKEELMKADWEGNGKMKFLHTPKAEVLESSRKVLATSLAGAAELGNATVVTETLPPEEEINNVGAPDVETTPEDLGFVVGEDVTQEKIMPTAPVAPIAQPVLSQMPVQEKINLSKIFHGFSSRFSRGPKISSLRNNNSLYFVLGVIALLILAGGISWWLLPKATINVFVSPKSFQEEVSISFSPGGQFDETTGVIPAQVVTTQESGNKTKSTTGVKLIGDKATGSVQIANGNGNPIDLPSGTILTSSAGLKFVTNVEASISGQLIPGSPGTATVAVTAGDVGAQYNLAKNEVFKVGVFDKSQVAATGTSNFTGGSSQQIAAVSTNAPNGLTSNLRMNCRRRQ